MRYLIGFGHDDFFQQTKQRLQGQTTTLIILDLDQAVLTAPVLNTLLRCTEDGIDELISQTADLVGMSATAKYHFVLQHPEVLMTPLVITPEQCLIEAPTRQVKVK